MHPFAENLFICMPVEMILAAGLQEFFTVAIPEVFKTTVL